MDKLMVAKAVVISKVPEVFYSGYRPAFSWVGVFSIFYELVFRPTMNGMLSLFSLPPVFEGADIGLLSLVVGGIVGVGALRTIDKVNGVESKGK